MAIKEGKKISVVIPVYNGANDIKKSVNSVMNKCNLQIEVIVVDDCSEDETPQVLKDLACKDSRIKIFRHEKKRGPLCGRLTGVKQASGEFISFLDCGDTLNIDNLYELIDSADPSAHIIVGGADLRMPRLGKIAYSRPHSEVKKLLQNDIRSLYNTKDVYKYFIEGQLPGSMWDKIYRREWLINHLPQELNTQVGEDYYFTLMVFPHSDKVQFSDCSFYQWTYSGLASKYFLDKFQENAKTMNVVFDRIEEEGFPTIISKEEAREAVAYKFLYQTMLGIAEGCRKNLDNNNLLALAADMFATEAMNKALKYAKTFKGVPTSELTPETMIPLAKAHIKRHKKYYLFTRILNLIYRQ